jgi:hypothetical protein
MSFIPVVAALILMAASCASPAFAQVSRQPYLLGTVGHGAFADEEGGLGGGGVYGAGAGVQMTDRISLEGMMTRTEHEQAGGITWRGKPLTVTARALYHPGSAARRARWFLGAGIGYIRYTGVRTDSLYSRGPLSPPELVSEEWSVAGVALDVGAGIDVKLGSVFFIRPEGWLVVARPTRIRPAPEPPYYLSRFAAGVGARF